MWGVGGDAFDSLKDFGFLEFAELSLDEPKNGECVDIRWCWDLRMHDMLCYNLWMLNFISIVFMNNFLLQYIY